jgi:hypothetical protein
MSDWYQTGNEGLETAKRIQEEQAAGYGPMRFFLKPGNSAKVTFLDTEGFYFNEHNLFINNRWGNFYTCLRDFSECPMCDAGFKPGYVCAYTILDHSKYEGKNGIIQHRKKLLVVRPSVMNKLARRRETLEGNLTLAVLRFTRDSKDECNTGEDIEFAKRLSREDVLKFKPSDSKESDEEFLKPYDYMTLFAPKPVEELRRVSGQSAPVGAEDYGSSASSGAAIPPNAMSVNEQSLDAML